MIWLVPLVPVAAAPVLWLAGPNRSRARICAPAAALLAGVIALAGWAAAARPQASYRWGAGLTLRLAVDDTAAVVGIVVPAAALLVVAYASFHERRRGLSRLVAILVGFAGAMELLVLADDVLTLLIGWELVGACSWALIGSQWEEAAKPAAAAHAFLVTRFGDLGLFAAAGAAAAGTGSLAYADLGRLDGGWLHLFVGGMVLAAAAKSAQLPFSPWLFSAMAGPTSVSALLHAATMVAAGAFALIRLQPVLDRAAWFGPVVIAVGLATALAGGVIATMQQDAKKLLAASTSAQYGLMFVAVGAGYPAAALAHLVAHAAFKVGLFLAAGIAIEAASTSKLGRMRLGRELKATATASAVLALALAAVPPLGAAWTKEVIVSAAGKAAPSLAAGVVLAGGLSAWYAARFHLLAFGPPPPDTAPKVALLPGGVEQIALWASVVASLGLGVLWWPGAHDAIARLAGGELPEGPPVEAIAALVVVAAAAYGALTAFRSGALGREQPGRRRAAVADWFALPTATKAAIADPVLAVARGLGRFDTLVLDAPIRAATAVAPRLAVAVARADHRVVDAGVRATAALTRRAARLGATVTERGVDGAVGQITGLVAQGGRDVRRLHTGLAHHYYVVAAGGAVVLVVVAAVAR